MKSRKIIAAALTASMALSLAACSNTKKYETALADEGFEQMEYSEYKKLDESEDDIEDGVFIVTSEDREVGKLIKHIDNEIDSDEAVSMLFAEKAQMSEEMLSKFGLYVISFSDADAAEDYYDEFCDVIDEGVGMYEDFGSMGKTGVDEDDNAYYGAVDLDVYGDPLSIRMGNYLDGDTVTIIIEIAYYDEAEDYANLVDDICDTLELVSPSEAI